MVGLRSPSIGFGLAFLALACFFGSALAAPQVYLSLTGSTAWDGACPTSGSSCSAGAPCSLPSHGITLDGSVTKCEISFGAGAYGTESEKQKVSIIQAASGSTNLTVSFDGSNGGVVGLDITLSANEVGYNGLISQSNLNVILGPVQTVRMYALKSNTTRAFFTGTQPLAYSPSITVLRSEMMFDKLMVADLFTFDITDSATSKTVTSFKVDHSVIGLDYNFVGLISVSSGLRIETVSVVSSTIAYARAIITYEKPMPTVVSLKDSHVTVGSNVIKSTTPIDPLTFNSKTSAMSVKVDSGTLRGATGSLANLYDDNACADFEVSTSEISNLAFGCSGAYNSTKDTDRCSYNWMISRFTDSRICLANRAAGSADFSAMDLKFFVSVPTLAPVMTHFQNVTFDTMLVSASFETVARETTASALRRVDPIPEPIEAPPAVAVPTEAPIEAPIAAAPVAVPVASPVAAPVASPVASSGIAFLFSGAVSFDSSTEVNIASSSLVLSPQASLSASEVSFTGFVTFGDKSTISGSRFLTLRAPLTFSGPGSIRALYGATIIPDAHTTVPGVPIISFVNGATFKALEYPLYFLSTHLYIKWPKNMNPGSDTYTALNSVVAVSPWTTTRYSAQKTNYQFTVWASSTPACGENCADIKVALSSVVAPGNAPSAPAPRSRVPYSRLPVGPPSTAPYTSPALGYCIGSVPLNFVCREGVWTHSGDWTVYYAVTIDGDDSISPIQVNGNVTIKIGGSLTFLGNKATLKVSGCVTAPTSTSIFLDYSSGWPKTESWTQEVIRLSSNCRIPGGSLPFTVRVPDTERCRTFTAHPQGFLNSLTVSWTTSRAKCHLPLIIGLSVGAVVVVAIGSIIAFFIIRSRRAAAARRAINGGFSSDYEPLMNDH